MGSPKTRVVAASVNGICSKGAMAGEEQSLNLTLSM
jgi:hypothetical protein